MFTLARGSAAGVAEPYEVPVAPPLGAGEELGDVVAESTTVITMERTVVSALAYSVAVPTPFAVTTPVVALVLATVATVFGDVDQVIGTSGIGVPLMSRTTPDTCVTSPILSVVAFAVIDVMCTATPLVVVVAESGVAAVVSLAVEVVSPAASADRLLTVIVLVASSAVDAEIVVVPVVVPPVRTPDVETSTTVCEAVVHVTVSLRMTLPCESFTTALACTCCPGASDESGAESSMEVPRRPFRWALAVRPSAERGSRRLEDSQETSRRAWSPTSTGVTRRYERWGGRIEKRNLSVWRRTRVSTHHSERSDATVYVVSWVGASTRWSTRRARAVTASARRSEMTIVGVQTMRCAERHSCDRSTHFPYEKSE